MFEAFEGEQSGISRFECFFMMSVKSHVLVNMNAKDFVTM